MAKVSTDPEKIEELLARGVEEVIVRGELEAALRSGKQLRVKLGIDPTSPNIHIGRAIPLWKLRAFQELGHRVVFIVGDFTGIIGDTSDKDAERPMLSEEAVRLNIETYFAQAFKVLDKRRTETYYNSKWLKKLGFREIGRMADLFGLHEFEARENIAKRLSAGRRVSLRELLYPIMQGYDSVAVEADVEIGGTDQKFNLLAGRTIQSHYSQKPQSILTTSLLEGLDGRKMSSSWGNTVNLTDEPGEMFGKIMSLKDELIPRYFELCTNLGEEEIARIVSQNPRDQKLRLARTIVSMYHGGDAGRKAEESFVRIFSEKQKPEEMPLVRVAVESMTLVDLLLVTKSASSKSEARRLIEQGAVRVNDVKQQDPNERVAFSSERVLQVGPRRFVRVKR